MDNSSFVLRIKFLYGGVFLLALILLVRLYFIQIVNGEYFSDRADRQYTATTQNSFSRGSIFFKDKQGKLISAASLKTGFVLSINPRILEDPEEVYKSLSPLLKIDHEIFIQKASKKDDPYEEILTKIDKEIADKIKDLKIPGVILAKEKWRVYPGGTLSCHTIGFVGFKGNVLAGRYGVERYYDSYLQRNTGDLYANFFAQIFLNVKETFSKKENSEGDIILSVEPLVQSFLEKELQEVMEKLGADSVAGVIINPQNGEIYAMAAEPSFDLNNFKQEDVSVFSNPIVESVFEMGSIIKPLTMAIGIDTGAVTASTKYYDSGSLTLNGKKIFNFDGKGRGEVDMQEVLNQSLNTGVAFVERKVGNERFAGYIKSLGLGEETGIDLPNETYGLINNLDSKLDVEYATASFGQGVAFTPIATVRALSSLANGGKLVTPHLGVEMKSTLGIVSKLSYDEKVKNVFKPDTTEEVTRMLVNVVDKALLHGAVKNERYSVAAKTGTAQIAKENGGGYYSDRYLHSFFGYFPAYDAKFLVFLYVVYPKNVEYASQSLTSPFMNVVNFLINFYEIPPDR